MDNKEFKEKEFKSLLLPQLQANPKGVTIPELVLATGLSNDWVEFTLRKLMNDYPSRIELNDKHQLVYIFDFASRKKTLSFKDILQNLLNALWSIFVFVFKAWIVVMLFTYLLFNSLVLALAITAITRNGSIAETVFQVLGEVFSGIFKAIFKKDKLDKGVLHEVFSYVFGATKLLRDESYMSKQLLNQIQYNQGKITIAEIIQITGQSLQEAEEQATKLLAHYQGDVEVNDNGVIIYVFSEFSHKKPDTNPTAKIWNNLLPKRKMNDNNAKTNTNIIVVNGFNLLMAIISPFIIEFMLFDENEVMPDSWLFFTLVFPFLFSVIFFLVPFFRSFFVKSKNRKINKVNTSYTVLGEIFAKLPRIYPNQISNDNILKQKAIDLEADTVVDNDGSLYYNFEKIERDLRLK